MRINVLTAAALLMLAPALPAQEGWRVVPDGGAPDSAVAFAAMAPGWHLTTRAAGAVLYHPAQAVRGDFSLEAEAFLFPGDSQEGWGIAAGVREGSPDWYAVLLRRDGSFAAVHMQHGELLQAIPWTRHAAILPGNADAPVKNVLRVDVAGEVVITVNGQRVAAFPRGNAGLDGIVGLRAGGALNLHVSRFDVTHHLAPRP